MSDLAEKLEKNVTKVNHNVYAIACSKEDVDKLIASVRENGELRRQVAELTARAEKAERAIESLTPGGSEFYRNPQYCAEFVREMRKCEHKALLRMSTELAAKDAKIAELERDNFYLRQDKQTAQNAAESYGRQLEQSESRIKLLTDALEIVLDIAESSDCYLGDGSEFVIARNAIMPSAERRAGNE